MYRKTSVITGLLLAVTSTVVCQDVQNQPKPRVPEDVLAASTPLVAWTWMQKPRPTPEPLPPPDKGVPQPDQQASAAPSAQAQEPITQTFTGKIVKDGGRYVLKVSSNTMYRLEGEGSVQQYEDRDVRVSGTLDQSGNTIHVVKIELLS